MCIYMCVCIQLWVVFQKKLIGTLQTKVYNWGSEGAGWVRVGHVLITPVKNGTVSSSKSLSVHSSLPCFPPTPKMNKNYQIKNVRALESSKMLKE